MQKRNLRKSIASKAKRSILLSRSQFEEHTDQENLRLSTLTYDIDEYFKLIIEFLKSESRSVSQNNLITEYLLSLTNLASLFPKIQADELNQHIFLYNLSKSLKFEYFEKHEMLMKYGEAGFNFYFLLKGAADIIVSKWHTVYLTEEKYLEYLMKLKIYGENDFLQKTLSKNNKQYLHLNQKALNDFVFEEVQKIKTQKDYENLSEEYQRFFRDFVLKANMDFGHFNDFSCFKFNNTFNGFNFNFEKNNNFSFNKKEIDYDENGNEVENNFERNLNINNKSINKDFNLGMKYNCENPEKNNYPNKNNSSSDLFNKSFFALFGFSFLVN